MKKVASKVPFKGTEEQAIALQKVIDENKHDSSNLMVVMQKAQDIYGYLPYEVQQRIADGMSVPFEKVYGVATFYAQFALSPKGKYNVSVCLGTACYVKGSGDIFHKLQDSPRNRTGRMHAGRQIQPDGCPLRRCLRTGARHDGQRGCLRKDHYR